MRTAHYGFESIGMKSLTVLFYGLGKTFERSKRKQGEGSKQHALPAFYDHTESKILQSFDSSSFPIFQCA